MPVNDEISDILLKFHISEKLGRGVPKIVETYGKECIEFRKNSIVIKIPFNWIIMIENKTDLTDNI